VLARIKLYIATVVEVAVAIKEKLEESNPVIKWDRNDETQVVCLLVEQDLH
jgi:hypothetical protein